MALPLGIAFALLIAPPLTPASDDGQSNPLVCDVAVRAGDVDYQEFAAATELRLPGVRVRAADGAADPVCAGRAHGFVELRASGPDSFELSFIVSDGRAWFRTVESQTDQAPRTLASALANLIGAIEDASAEADAHDVELPTEISEPEPEPEPEEPEPVEPDPPKPEGVDVEPTTEPLEPERAIVLELGPRVSATGLFGLAPGPGVRGGGAGVGLDLRLADGLGFGLDVRALTLRAGGLRLVRTRIAFGVGWVVRRGIFELPVIISGIVEPWVVRTEQTTRALGQPPLVGGGIRVAPGLIWPIAGGATQLRLGLPIGFELAVEAARGGLIPAITPDPDAPPVLRAGGVELSVGLELGVWLPVRERR